MLQQQQLNPRRYDALVVFVVIVWIVAMLSSCATQKKAEKFYKKHPIELAKQCAEKFPIVEQYIKGDSVTVYDTLWGLETRIDTVTITPDVVTKIVEKTVPKIVTKTITVHDTVIKENTAKTAVLSSENAKLKLDNVELNVKLSAAIQRGDDFRSKYHKTISWLVLCIVLIGVGTYLKIRKVI